GVNVLESGKFGAAMATLKIENSGPFSGTLEDVEQVTRTRQAIYFDSTMEVPAYVHKFMKKYLIAILLLLWGAVGVEAGTENDLLPIEKFPVPKKIDNLLFYIQRDPNTNTICYALNYNSDNKVDEKEPVRVFWIRY